MCKNSHIIAYLRICGSHFSAFLRILSNVNTCAHVIYATYFRNATYMQHICRIYATYFSAYFAKFRIFLLHILHQNGPHILRKISTINRYPYIVVCLFVFFFLFAVIEWRNKVEYISCIGADKMMIELMCAGRLIMRRRSDRRVRRHRLQQDSGLVPGRSIVGLKMFVIQIVLRH